MKDMPDECAKLIAAQQLELADLRQQVAQHNRDKQDVRNMIYCIGGPLNDNKLKYSREQMVIFQRIANLCEVETCSECGKAAG